MNEVRWSNDKELRILAALQEQAQRRQFLVFVVPGPHASSLLPVASGERNFDLALRFYSDPGENRKLAEHAEYVMTGGLSKFHAAALFIESLGLDESYDGYLFLDGDLEFDARQLSRFLSFVHAAGLDLAQPSVTRDSYCYWKMAYHQPGFVFRETSFVEVMAPYLSRAALGRTLETFTRSISTYGLDLVWPSLLDHRAIGVVDAFQIRHRDRVDHAEGRFYKYLKSIGVDLDEEERLMLAAYGVIPEEACSLRGYVWTRRWAPFGERPKLVSVDLGAPERKSNKRIMIDLSIQSARLRAPWGRPEPGVEAAIGPFLRGNVISRL